MPGFQCAECGSAFDVPEATLAKFPGWKPRFCLKHRKPASATANAHPKAAAGAARWAARRDAETPADRTAPVAITVAATAEALAAGTAPVQRLPPGRAAGSKTWRRGGVSAVDLSPAEVLATYTGGPRDGVFTDGGSRPNPGRGGWGFVHVAGGEIVAEGRGGDPRTTNNRMEMTALIHALESLPDTARTVIYSDSNLCVQTLTDWARGWERRGWTKNGGEIKNLDLVQHAWRLVQDHPGVRLQWIKAHDGSRWNEYADALATLGMNEGK